ncbi:hypothetical protein lerEdw1_016864 [Lerista edwardsae]|nr:hypothetical protein lerEdw1_016864 [Lerista edwardsae]
MQLFLQGILMVTLCSYRDGEWWKVVAVATGKNCYVPSNHVVKISHRWLYEGINREKAEELLLLPFNHQGSFLIRESQMRKGCYSLSIRHTNRASWDCVKHYRINRLENGWLYISPSLTFSSLQELVDYYSGHHQDSTPSNKLDGVQGTKTQLGCFSLSLEIGSGLCCHLKEPCFIQGSNSGLHRRSSKPVIVKRPALNWQEINSSDLFSEDVPEDFPISLGLREAINSYLLVTEDLTSEDINKKGRRCKDT